MTDNIKKILNVIINVIISVLFIKIKNKMFERDSTNYFSLRLSK